jgi:hypothetical protein
VGQTHGSSGVIDRRNRQPVRLPPSPVRGVPVGQQNLTRPLSGHRFDQLTAFGGPIAR